MINAFRILCVTLLVSLPTLAIGADHYIDPNAACPGSGTLADPWCTWPSSFRGGDTYMQKAGTTWKGMIHIHRANRTRPDKLLTITSYGEGSKPILRTGTKIEGEWTQSEDGLWSHQMDSSIIDPYPIGLSSNGIRLKGPIRGTGANIEKQLCKTAEWHYFEKERLIVTCQKPKSPEAGFHISYKLPSNPFAGIWLSGQTNILIDGLNLVGGRQSIYVTAPSSDIEIRNSKIGCNAGYGVSLHGSNTRDIIANVHIHHNLIDSCIRWGDLGYSQSGAIEGVYLRHHVTNTLIEHNEIVAWGHNGVYIRGTKADYPATKNVVRFNNFHCGPKSSYWAYCRPMNIDGAEDDAAHDNILSDNDYHDFTLGVQFNGNNNIFERNRCYNNFGPPSFAKSLGKNCVVISTYEVSKNNIIRNNELQSRIAFFQYGQKSRHVLSGHMITKNHMKYPVYFGSMDPKWIDLDSILIYDNFSWP